jgi:hypothetical protein
MNKSQKIKAIYREMKTVMGDTMTTREILESAHLFLETNEKIENESLIDFGTVRTPFVELPVDEVMSKWEWKVLNRECFFEDDYIPHGDMDELINNCLQVAA